MLEQFLKSVVPVLLRKEASAAVALHGEGGGTSLLPSAQQRDCDLLTKSQDKESLTKLLCAEAARPASFPLCLLTHSQYQKIRRSLCVHTLNDVLLIALDDFPVK